MNDHVCTTEVAIISWLKQKQATKSYNTNEPTKTASQIVSVKDKAGAQ